MSLTTSSILISQQSEKAVTMTRSLIKALQLTATAKLITVKLGSKVITLPLKIGKLSGNILVLPAFAAESLKLPWAGKCMVRSSGKRDVQLGPLIGILTSTTNDLSRPFGPRTPFIREFMNASTNRAFYFAFSPANVNWKDQEVTGFFPGAEGQWIRKTVPLPDVVYNRLPSRSAEKSVSVQGFKDRFVRRNIPLFNWSFFDKWDIYRLLEGEQEASKHVPESVNSPSSAEIQRMIEKHRFVYLKPTAGSLGFGIYRLTYNPSRGYFARFRQNGHNELIRFTRFEGLMKMLERHRLVLRNYVLQQGIRLIELDNCPIDFRFHMTKNGHNRWVTGGVGAKKAGKGSVTTHVRTGGMLMTPQQVLSRVYGSKSDSVLQNAKDVAIQLSEAIERNHNHPLGELGFDLGIDQNERVWMFEANSKPGRSIFKHPSLKAQGRASLENIIEHCLYLSKFDMGRDG